METSLYETRFGSGAAPLFRISAAAKHTCNHLDNTASSTQSLLMHAEKCIATRAGSLHH